MITAAEDQERFGADLTAAEDCTSFIEASLSEKLEAAHCETMMSAREEADRERYAKEDAEDQIRKRGRRGRF